MTTEIPEGNKVYPGHNCSLCGAEIEIFDSDDEIVYLSCPNSEGDDRHDEYRFSMKQLISWGWKFEPEDIINVAITNSITAEYLLADWGEKIGVYPDGTVGIGQSIGDEIAKDESPVICIGCPGFPNLDQTVFTNGLDYDEKNETYIDDDGKSMSIEECVVEACIIDPDFKEELIEKLLLYLRDLNAD